MKKLLNEPIDVVREMMEGLALAHPGLVLLEGETVAVRADAAQLKAAGKVALISGGGAGHEPAHAGYVGPGMLTAAVSGDVFTSPPTDAVLAAIRAVGGPAGVLLIIKNYTGDRLHFGLAAELARAEGIPCEMVVVADDVALAATSDSAGRRGIAGTVLVHKIAGAAAAAGLPLDAVKREAERAIASVGTMGVALSPCIVPAAGKPGFDLGPNEMELGLGIHGEAGVRRVALQPVDKIVDTLLDEIMLDRGIVAGTRVALLANNLGGTPAMEMALVFRRAVRRLTEKGILVERAWSGAFLTAIEMGGCSLTLMKVDDQTLARLDVPTEAPAWPAAHLGRIATKPRRLPKPEEKKVKPAPHAPEDERAIALRKILLATGQAWLEAERKLTELDRVVGDGDLGLSLARGARAIEADLPHYDLAQPAATLRALSSTLRRSLAGTSGALYAVLLLRAAAALEKAGELGPKAWSAALTEAHRSVAEVGGAKVGDRTMLDALVPAAEAFDQALKQGRKYPDALKNALNAARAGAARTAELKPRRGRSSYLGDRALGHVDPGAEAVVIWLDAVTRTLTS